SSPECRMHPRGQVFGLASAPSPAPTVHASRSGSTSARCGGRSRLPLRGSPGLDEIVIVTGFPFQPPPSESRRPPQRRYMDVVIGDGLLVAFVSSAIRSGAQAFGTRSSVMPPEHHYR